MVSSASISLPRRPFALACAWLGATALAAAGGSSFTPLPLDVPGYLSPTGVSADGATVVGGSYIVGVGNQARRWRSGIGFDYPGPSVGQTATWCSGVSADGSVVAGGSGHAVFGDLEGWMRYGSSVGHVGSPPGHDTSDCTAVSADGVVTAGYGGHQSAPNLFEAARYTEQSDWQNLGFLPGGTNSKATGASGDGSVLVGWSNDAALSIARAFRWTAASGMVSLGNLPNGNECRATGVSADGNTVVGSDYVVQPNFSSIETAWRWTAASGMQSLGQLLGGQASTALAVSHDGSTVVGTADQGGSYHAFVWDEAHGMRKLYDVLLEQGVTGLGGWELDDAACIAGSGPYWIAGTGGDPQGLYSAWLVRYEPDAGAITAYCFGDGSGTPCPCGNTGAIGHGCANSGGGRGLLETSGGPSVGTDDLAFHASGLLHGQPGLCFAGLNPVANGDGASFGDGLRCAGGGVVRLGVRTPDTNGDANYGPGLGAFGGWSAGDTRRFQVWYRDPSGPCASGFNLTNGVQVDFAP